MSGGLGGFTIAQQGTLCESNIRLKAIDYGTQIAWLKRVYSWEVKGYGGNKTFFQQSTLITSRNK